MEMEGLFFLLLINTVAVYSSTVGAATTSKSSDAGVVV
jgi:hypothetical protein